MTFGVTLAALTIEAVAGYPEALYRRVGHPVTWLGWLIDELDTRLNRETDSFSMRRARGVVALMLIAAVALIAGAAVEALAGALPYGWLLLAVLSSSLIAQRSLYAHVAAVVRALPRSPSEGRREVAKIVGRDVASLDSAGVARAAIESLAENFSDGVVAPVFFLALFGLPGALLYKTVNTADSMIGHKSDRYLAFGWAAARCDDLLNLIPARLASGLIVAAAAVVPGASPGGGLSTALADAGKHASPNAGWPEAAMAGALGLTLGGARAYHGQVLDAATLGKGRRNATPADIFRALTIYKGALAVLWLLALAGAVASGN
ncbi:adenosylcobinamide-phosphate synthase CbiB [Methylocystis echinoides]|uniref:Cobalamin biosynthesis protein CobD n=1 Tax=Methylocystis echinoides TaxID=29468 RepID=A0A9W6GRW4_9HYPH|nr:adenosylcobinamide-phosphate synthase CbiB [Methylocystis echinoides]GLI91725.1 cobalamin biosynthesis protein CobD [Methylocystis echinoides]